MAPVRAQQLYILIILFIKISIANRPERSYPQIIYNFTIENEIKEPEWRFQITVIGELDYCFVNNVLRPLLIPLPYPGISIRFGYYKGKIKYNKDFYISIYA